MKERRLAMYFENLGEQKKKSTLLFKVRNWVWRRGKLVDNK